jgi:hypothetical protein
MKHIILLLTFFFICFSGKSQQIQYASKLIKFSSDLGGKQFGIKRILGKPDCFPQGGNSANAWMPKNALDGREIIEVGFDKPQTVKQVAVFENLNAGNVMKIAVDDGSGKYETVWTRKIDYKTPFFRTKLITDRSYYFKRKRRKVQEADYVEANAGIEYAILDNPVSNVVAVKIFFSFALIPGEKEVDAIAISDLETPIIPIVNSKPEFDNLPQPTKINFGDLDCSNSRVSDDGNKLYFTVSGTEKDLVYSATKENSNWSNPKPEVDELNKNEKFNYISFCDSNFILKGGIEYLAGTIDSGFEFLENQNGKYVSSGQIKIAAYNDYDTTADATITSDKKVLIMGLESDITQGGSDLYFANRKEDGTYGLLQNMGKTINSASDETAPFLLSDQKTMIFISDGYSNYGNFDIYVTQRLDETWKKWSEPINLGSKINSEHFEGTPFYDEKTETLYFNKTIDGKSSLYFVKIPKTDLVGN